MNVARAVGMTASILLVCGLGACTSPPPSKAAGFFSTEPPPPAQPFAWPPLQRLHEPADDPQSPASRDHFVLVPSPGLQKPGWDAANGSQPGGPMPAAGLPPIPRGPAPPAPEVDAEGASRYPNPFGPKPGAGPAGNAAEKAAVAGKTTVATEGGAATQAGKAAARTITAEGGEAVGGEAAAEEVGAILLRLLRFVPAL